MDNSVQHNFIIKTNTTNKHRLSTKFGVYFRRLLRRNFVKCWKCCSVVLLFY